LILQGPGIKPTQKIEKCYASYECRKVGVPFLGIRFQADSNILVETIKVFVKKFFRKLHHLNIRQSWHEKPPPTPVAASSSLSHKWHMDASQVHVIALSQSKFGGVDRQRAHVHADGIRASGLP
jgi:hypothetical protein